MFIRYNFFRRHNENKEIKNYKEFYKHFSNKIEFGGKHSHLDKLINNRFIETTGFVITTILRSQPKTILDLGCGAGLYLPLSGYFSSIRYRGVDYAKKSILAAQKTYPNIDFFEGDLFNFRAPEPADLIILSSVLILYQKSTDRERILKTVSSNLSVDGTALIIVWNHTFVIETCLRVAYFMGRLCGAPRPKDFMGVHFTESEMKSELRQNGFDIIDVKHTSSKYGAIECAKYLSLRKFKRDFEKENMLHRKKMNLNEYQDFCASVGSDSVWVKFIFKISSMFPSFFAMYSVYVIKKNLDND